MIILALLLQMVTVSDAVPSAPVGGHLDLTVLKAKVAGSWDMDEASGTRADDIGANDLDTEVGTPTGVAGVNSNAADFTAPSDSLQHALPTAAIARTPGWAVSLWAKQDDTLFRVMAGKDDGSGTDREWRLTSIPPLSAIGNTWPPEGKGYITFGVWSNDGSETCRAATELFALGEWNHVVARFRPDSTIDFVINGYWHTTRTDSTPLGNSTISCDFDANNNRAISFSVSGTTHPSNQLRWDGQIDEVIIFDEDITDAEAFWLSRHHFYADLP